MKIYIDGKFLDEESATISVFDHGLLYGDGVFEGIRAYNGRVFKLKEHIDRLFYSAKAILLTIPMPHDQVTEALLETCRQNDIHDGYIRLVVTRGIGGLGLNPNKCKRPSIIVIADRIQLYSAEVYERGLDIITVPTVRNLHSALNPAIKSLNYLNNILAKIEANNAGCEEAIMLNSEGYVAECTGDNLFILKGKHLITPPLYAGALYGITRGVVMELAGRAGLTVSENNLTRYDLFNADECFLTGTAAEIIPVVKIDGRVIGSGRPGPMTRKLEDDYRKETKSSGEPIYRTVEKS
jgi:branched-chain amino acid aminotransferase